MSDDHLRRFGPLGDQVRCDRALRPRPSSIERDRLGDSSQNENWTPMRAELGTPGCDPLVWPLAYQTRRRNSVVSDTSTSKRLNPPPELTIQPRMIVAFVDYDFGLSRLIRFDTYSVGQSDGAGIARNGCRATT